MMNHAQAAYRAGCIATELEARGYAGKDGFTPTALSNASRQPDKLLVVLGHAFRRAVRDAEVIQLLEGFDPPKTPCPVGDQHCFWVGFYHQKIARELPATFPARLRSLRESAGLSVAQLAEACGLHRQAVYKLESGESRPTWDTVQQLAAALGVTTDTFKESK